MALFSFQGRTGRKSFFLISMLPFLLVFSGLIFHGAIAYYLYKDKFSLREVTYIQSQTYATSSAASLEIKEFPEEAPISEAEPAEGQLKPWVSAPTFGWLLWPALVMGSLLTWIFMAAEVRRLHDIGQTGLFALLNFVPGASFFLWLFLLFAKGEAGDNRYGPKPR